MVIQITGTEDEIIQFARTLEAGRKALSFRYRQSRPITGVFPRK